MSKDRREFVKGAASALLGGLTLGGERAGAAAADFGQVFLERFEIAVAEGARIASAALWGRRSAA